MGSGERKKEYVQWRSVFWKRKTKKQKKNLSGKLRFLMACKNVGKKMYSILSEKYNWENNEIKIMLEKLNSKVNTAKDNKDFLS